MKQNLEKSLKKGYNSWSYGLEIIAGTLLVVADNHFNLQGQAKEIYDYATNLGGVLLIADGLRRIDNISTHYKKVLLDYILESKQNNNIKFDK
ncbi:MAG: hypothetical protein PHD81_04515 [Candidatus Nanoarchaeia archaeon]|nr:hypothetical protein [Candidatus Nanoarchaeia archaeon]MDD5588341.1 hypothetical protein [Candidatus Nanoarchaeia archaeon]